MNKTNAPYGIIFQNNEKVIIGVDHSKPLILSDDLVEKVKAIPDVKYYYEGDGGDKSKGEHIFNPMVYTESWDSLVTLPHDRSLLCYTIFSTNSSDELNRMIVDFTDKAGKKSILQMLGSKGGKWGYDKKHINEMTWKRFLINCKEDFYKKSLMIATKENVSNFLSYGTARMWPHNWESYPNPSGKIAHSMSTMRDKALINFKKGVYFTGCGHLLDIIKLSPSLKLIGGNLIK